MWTPENIAALCTGITGILGAVAGLIVAVRHQNNPDAHGGAGHGEPGGS